MKNFVPVFFLVLSLSVSAQDIHRKIRLSVENKDYKTAFTELQNLERADKKIFTLNNYDYLSARMAEKRDDFAAATAYYQSVVNRNSVLSEYALLHLSQIARAGGNLILERIYLRELFSIAPSGLTNDAANNRLARSYFESEDFNEAIQILNNPHSGNATANEAPTAKNKAQTFNSAAKPKTENRENLALLGEAYFRSGKLNDARNIFTKLITELPNSAQPDDFALSAVKSLDEIDVGAKNFGKTAPLIPAPENQRRALIYQFNRNFPLARLHFKAILENYPSGNHVSDSLFQIGRTFAQEGAYNEAINWFERVQAEFFDEPISREALLQTASAYSRVNKPKEAIARYQKFIEKYPEAENLDRAYLNIIDILRDQGENSNALKWAAKTREIFKGKLPEALALFAQARINISQNDWVSALTDLTALQSFSDLGGTRAPGGTNKAEIMFLKGFVLENLNRFDEAIDAYLSIPDGRNEYYGWRATERLKAIANGENTKRFVEDKITGLSQTSGISVPNEERKKQQLLYRLTQSLYRSANNSKLLEDIKYIYGALPEYQKIPEGKILDLGRKEVLKEKNEERVFSENYHQVLADELLFLGLYDEAAPELEIGQKSSVRSFQEDKLRTANEDIRKESNVRQKNLQSAIGNRQSKDFAYTLAVFYKRGDMANRAVSYIEPLWKNVPADFQIELIPREQLEMLYPAPYADSLLKFAPEKKVDPRFVLAIMRQESRFRADVKSNAAARGLLQFISTTGNQIAEELGRENFNQNDLYNPPTAILFGSQYLSDLFKKFPAQPAAVAASYNGGEDNMARWLARSKTDDPDRYVAEIIFSQSKDYVYKVMSNYRVYQMLYDEELRTKN